MEYVIALTDFTFDQNRQDPLVNILPRLSHLAITEQPWELPQANI